MAQTFTLGKGCQQEFCAFCVCFCNFHAIINRDINYMITQFQCHFLFAKCRRRIEKRKKKKSLREKFSPTQLSHPTTCGQSLGKAGGVAESESSELCRRQTAPQLGTWWKGDFRHLLTLQETRQMKDNAAFTYFHLTLSVACLLNHQP